MPIALLLQFCLAAAAPRTLVANHNRTASLLYPCSRHKNSSSYKNKIGHVNRTTTARSHLGSLAFLATTAAVSSPSAQRYIAALAVPPASSTATTSSSSGSRNSKRLYALPIGCRPWARSVAGATSGAAAPAVAVAPVVTVHHVYADKISFSSGSVPPSSASASASSLNSNTLGAAAALRGMASSSSGVRRRSSAKNSVDEARAPAEDTAITSASCPTSRPSSVGRFEELISTTTGELMGPPPAPVRASTAAERTTTRASRASTASSSASSARRRSNPNRLSLTLPLPVALPTPEPTRPTPAPSVVSHPPTPASGSLASSGTGSTSWASGDGDPNDLIIAVAAQERRVLELREELGRAEAELSTLKNRWALHEGGRKRTAARATRAGALHSMPATPRGDAHAAAAAGDESIAARRSIELDRRRAMLLSQQLQQQQSQQHSQQQQQQQSQNTPGSPRRRIILRGGHARTLSLLSPTKTDKAYPLHPHQEPLSTDLGIDRRSTDLGTAYRTAAIQKRASWQPPPPPSSSRARPSGAVIPPPGLGMAAIVEDLKQGFKTLYTFVDDIRQVTVGDEPITGHHARRPRDEEWAVGGGLSRSATPVGDAVQIPRAAVAPKKNLLDDDDEVDPVSDHSGNKAAARKKHFSWAPLEFSNLDAEWANWESSATAISASTATTTMTMTTRWSGTTATSAGDDILPVTTIATDENTSCNDTAKFRDEHEEAENRETLRERVNEKEGEKKKNRSGALDELLPQMVTRLSPGNIKRATSEFMEQWEKSLGVPPVGGGVEEQENLITL